MNISKVMFKQIPKEICDTHEIGKFYFYQNALGLNDQIDQEFEQFEIDQQKIRSKLIKEFVDETGIHPKPQSSLYGISSLHDTGILVCKL